jgi:hypothetical protein
VAVIKGRNVRIEVGATYGTPIAVQVVPQGYWPTIIANSHGLANFSAGYFNGVAGMPQIEGQAFQVGSATTNGFVLAGLNTTPYDTYASGFVVPVLTWLTIAESTSYTITVPDAAPIDRTTIRDFQQRNRGRGLLGAQTLAMNLLAFEEGSAAHLVCENAAIQGFGLIVRITHKGGFVRLCRAQPGLVGEDVQLGAVGTQARAWSIDGFALAIPGISAPPAPPPPPPPPPAPGATYVDPTYVAATYVA